MSSRRSYVDWKPFTGHEKLKSGKTYMVFEIMNLKNEKCGKPHFATYYDRGDVVRPSLRQDFDVKGKPDTPEGRLMEAIFGKTRACVIPHSGFYIMTGDYGIDDEFEGCTEMPVCVGNAVTEPEREACPCMWAEMPLEPADFAYTENVRYNRNRTEDEQKLYDNLNARLQADNVALEAFYGACGKDRSVDDVPLERPLGPCMYRLSSVKMAERILGIAETCRKLAAVPEDELSDFQKRFHAMKPDDGQKVLAKFMEDHDIRRKLVSYVIDALLFVSVSNGSHDIPSFCWCRDRILSRGGTRALDTPAVLQEARGRASIPWRIGRIVRLMRLGAPDVILHNEIRIAAETESMFRDVDAIISVNPDLFADEYGVWPDGTRREGKPCKVGDSELVHLDEEDEDPDDWTEDGQRYIWAFSPNFLMRSDGAPILDREKHVYLRDDAGNVILYEDAPDELLKQLNTPLA